MTPRQIVNVDTLKAASGDFTTMRKLAMRFRGLFRGGSVAALDIWLTDARQCGVDAMRRFAVTIRHDIGAVQNAVLEPWSNGQAEGRDAHDRDHLRPRGSRGVDAGDGQSRRSRPGGGGRPDPRAPAVSSAHTSR